MKKFEEMTYDEKKEVAALFANWLEQYTDEVIKRVTDKADEIVANEFAMNLLRELKQREEKEEKDFTSNIYYLLDDYKTFSKHSVHFSGITHASSYRDVLYDMYIASK